MRQDPFDHPRFHVAQGRPVGDSLKVPFGLRDGRMWRPRQVAPGLACGCVCPACQAPLVARATDSEYRRPHFAHMAQTDCRAGYETALHRKAKELLAEHAHLLLPAWDGEGGMPNPPSMHDDDGQWLLGRRVEFPACEASLSRVRIEEGRGDYIPDVIAMDDWGELLIEIRVSHAVDPLKRRRIQSEGGRLVEIDLSKLDTDIVLDDAKLLHWVLNEPTNRYWLSCPEATEAWREAHRELKIALAQQNREIALEQQRREEIERSKRHSLEQVRLEEAERCANREKFREQERARYQRELEELPALVSIDQIQVVMDEYQARDQEAAERLIVGIPSPAHQEAVRYCGPNAWIYQVHPSLWQAASYHHFVLKQASGPQFNQRDLARWIIQQFGREETLYKLFRAQYAFRDKARKAGIRKHRISFWAFTDLENQQIPDFYRPINAFADRLLYIGALQRVPNILGELCIPTVPDEGDRNERR